MWHRPAQLCIAGGQDYTPAMRDERIPGGDPMKRWIASAGLVLMAAHARGQQPAMPAFPRSAGKDLNGRALALPRDFAGPVNLLFVAFERRQQAEVDTWISFAQEMQAAHPGLATYELPTIGRAWGLIRGFIDGGMRSGIPDTEVRASTVTLYLDVRSFCRALGVTSTKTIAVLLVTRNGEILALGTGPYSPETAAPLAAALASALAAAN